jgi:hypothetical protein
VIQTTPARNLDGTTKIDGTVVICLKDGRVEEVVSDLQLDVQVFSVDDDYDGGRGYQGRPSRPLWEFLRKLMHFHSTNEK